MICICHQAYGCSQGTKSVPVCYRCLRSQLFGCLYNICCTCYLCISNLKCVLGAICKSYGVGIYETLCRGFLYTGYTYSCIALWALLTLLPFITLWSCRALLSISTSGDTKFKRQINLSLRCLLCTYNYRGFFGCL